MTDNIYKLPIIFNTNKIDNHYSLNIFKSFLDASLETRIKNKIETIDGKLVVYFDTDNTRYDQDSIIAKSLISWNKNPKTFIIDSYIFESVENGSKICNRILLNISMIHICSLN